MSLLIKAKNFLNHANIHSQSNNDFDIMIAIHSLDNSIEYILRIIVKHLRVEDEIGDIFENCKLMDIFGKLSGYLNTYALLNNKPYNLPHREDIKNIRVLRNNVQHGMILPVQELKNYIKQGNTFFIKVLNKIFGIELHEILYSTIITNADIKSSIKTAEEKISTKKYLEAIVACRDAFEFGNFLYQDQSRHFSKAPALAFMRNESIDLYHYTEKLDEDVRMLQFGIDSAKYAHFKEYLHYIPGDYRAEKSGYAILQREWEKDDADFCYMFVSETILKWQYSELKPIHKLEANNSKTHDKREWIEFINGLEIPRTYEDKACIYGGYDYTGHIYYCDEKTKEMFSNLNIGDICSHRTKCLINDRIWKDMDGFINVKAIDVRLLINNPTIWEVVFCYKEIPYTEMIQSYDMYDINTVNEKIFEQLGCTQTGLLKIKKFLNDKGVVDTVEKAFLLNEQLDYEETNGIQFYSEPLIKHLKQLVNINS